MSEAEIDLVESEENGSANCWDELKFFDSLCDVYSQEDLDDMSSEFRAKQIRLMPISPDAPQPKNEPVEDSSAAKKWEKSKATMQKSLLAEEEETGMKEPTVLANSAASLLGQAQVSSAKEREVSSRNNEGHDDGNADTKKSDIKKEELKEDEVSKRKKAVQAAKANRDRKKRQMEELRRSNVELMKERREFRRIVGELQLRVQASREAGAVDLETENELLRAELQEHKRFIAQFKRLADGTPVSETQKKVALWKGAKAAIGQVVGLLNTRYSLFMENLYLRIDVLIIFGEILAPWIRRGSKDTQSYTQSCWYITRDYRSGAQQRWQLV